MTKLFIRALSLIAMATSAPLASANTANFASGSFIASPERIGSAELRWLGIKLYKADLYTERGEDFDWSRPFQLDLTYQREFSGQALVKATLLEIERVEGGLQDGDAIMAKLAECFRDVKPADRYSAVAVGANAVRFFLNNEETCLLEHDNIRARFLGIWLSDSSRELAASQALRGLD
jgi:hypothetical protein